MLEHVLSGVAGLVVGSLATWAWCAGVYGSIIRERGQEIRELRDQVRRLIPDAFGGRVVPSSKDLHQAYARMGYSQGGSVDSSGLAHPRKPN